MADNPAQVTTGRCRTSFPNLVEPRAPRVGSGAPKFGIMLLIPKADKVTYKALIAAERAALENGKTKHFNGKVPSKYKSIIKDGDDPDEDLDKYPERENHWYMSVSSAKRPTIVGRHRGPDGKLEQLDPSEVYSGCYIRAQIGAFAYSGESKGISFGLNHVQFLADGEPLDGSTSAESVFDDLDDDEDDDDLV